MLIKKNASGKIDKGERGTKFLPEVFDTLIV